jgi:hypothetical protein
MALSEAEVRDMIRHMPQTLQSYGVKRQGIASVCRMCPPARPYVELQVPENVHRIQEVSFRITSRDQGR